MRNENTVIEQVTNYFGNGYKAAKALGVTSQQYYFWISKNKIPFKHGNLVERMTNGKIKAIQVYEDALK
jgi:hypothetical protein